MLLFNLNPAVSAGALRTLQLGRGGGGPSHHQRRGQVRSAGHQRPRVQPLPGGQLAGDAPRGKAVQVEHIRLTLG